MNIIEAIFLGLVQGLAEFLPISSSGHLVIVQEALGITAPVLLFDTLLHLGTLGAVLVAFRQEIWSLIKKPFQPLTGYLVIATIPAVIGALLLGDMLDTFFFRTPWLVGVCFILTAGVLYYAAKVSKNNRTDMTKKDAMLMGVAQAVALLPGLSRSGLTTSMGMQQGLDRAKAAKFSLLMSLPAIVGACVLQTKEVLETGGSESFPVVFALVGTAVAAVTGFYAIHFLVKLAGENKLKVFCPYLLILGLLVILDSFVLHLVF